jgi:asparagine synthase (glutamine-hydrolysing)
MFLAVSGPHAVVSKSDDLAILLRGQVVGSDGNVKLSVLADRIRNRYHESGSLYFADLEGSFSVVVMDAKRSRVSFYRNLVDSCNTFYTMGTDGLLFGSNLAELLDMMPSTPRPSQEVLPLFFLFRYVPGPRTLFTGISRLLPGAEAVFETTTAQVHQRRTFAEFRKQETGSEDVVERLDVLMRQIARESHARTPRSAVLFSGGVDSSYLQAHWNFASPGGSAPSYCAALQHPMTLLDTEYARSSASSLKTNLTLVPVNDSYASYLIEAIALTGEPPNHVQAAYFPILARSLAAAGISLGVCGQAADGLFGFESTRYLQNAALLRYLVPLSILRRMGAVVATGKRLERLRYTFRIAEKLYDFRFLEHPYNTCATYADWPSTFACFGNKAIEDALAERRSLVCQYNAGDHVLELLQAAGLTTDTSDSCAYWNTLFASQGVELQFPFLDSRILGLVLSLRVRDRFPFRQPKAILKRGLSKYLPAEQVYRRKRGFGQPIFEWLGPGGQLRALVNNIDRYDFVDPKVLEEARARPNWFLYSLLCYDIWHKTFIAKTTPIRSDMISTSP